MSVTARNGTICPVRTDGLLPRATALLALTVAIVPAATLPALPLPRFLTKSRTFYPLNDPRIPAVLRDANIDQPGAVSVVSASDGAVWLSTSTGLKRFDPTGTRRDRWQFFSGQRWLPDDNVLELAPDNQGGIWVRTATGISHIEMTKATLEERTPLFEDRIETRHVRHGLVADSRLTRPGDLTSNQPEPSDNDGLWTAIYGAAECFRYAALKGAGDSATEALARATRSVEALLFLEHVTGIQGYPARSYVVQGETHPADGRWHGTSDGKFTWKGDTSSDEITGHFFLYSVAFDLLPDAALKQRIAGAASRIASHILSHGYTLTGLSGKPTTWGNWSPAYFATPAGSCDSTLNSIELLSYLKSAAHITGDAHFETEYHRAAYDMGYAQLATRHLELCHQINYSDEELAMLSFYQLFRYETSDELLTLYRKALEQWWKNEQREKNPLWTFIYLAANPGAKADLEGAVWILQHIPLDLIDWTVINSHRSDVPLDGGPDRFGRPQTTLLLPPDERPVMKWNGNPFVVDGGSGGAREDDGAFFLLPYWLGRYHKFIEEAPPKQR